MGTNWVLENLLKALATWTEKMQEIWTLLTTSPQEFRGGTIWSMQRFDVKKRSSPSNPDIPRIALYRNLPGPIPALSL